jgi:hypothetical protein
MSDKQQTALEWLVETFKITNVDLSHHKLIIEQAKEMEKEQAINDYCEGRNSVINKQIISSEDYYEQTYGGNK